MSKFFLYNGVKLPALPEWDKTVYPYAFIYALGTNDNGAVSEVCTLVVSSSNQMVYDSIGIGFRYDDIGIGKTISADKTQWIDWTWSSGGSEYFYVKRDEPTDILYIRVVWANFDVLNANGSVYVAASDPVPVADKFPLKGWLNWHVIGLCSRPLPVSVRDPVAYLYNGVRLPGLPEWDRVAYPYAWIVVTKTILTGNREKATLYATTNVTNSFTIGPGYLRSGIYLDDLTTGWEEFIVSEGRNYMSYTNVKWTNFDLYNGESIYMAASEPVPVYE